MGYLCYLGAAQYCAGKIVVISLRTLILPLWRRYFELPFVLLSGLPTLSKCSYLYVSTRDGCLNVQP